MTNSDLHESMRPDLCGAIVLSGRKYKGWKVLIATPTAWKIPDGTLEILMTYAKNQATPLIYIENFHTNGEYAHFSRSGYGPKEFVECVTRDSIAGGPVACTLEI